MRFAPLLISTVSAAVTSENGRHYIPGFSMIDRADRPSPAILVDQQPPPRRRVVRVATSPIPDDIAVTTSASSEPTTSSPETTQSSISTTSAPETTRPTTSTTRPTTSSVSATPSSSSNETWTLSLGPKFIFGAAQKRGYSVSGAPEGTMAACPTDRDYCIDSRYSDEGTCMYPSPETIKECLDDTCAAHPANEAIFRSKKEDSYCKDWQKSPEGRVCHWTSDVFCSCPKFSIVYTNAVFVPIGNGAPQGYAVAQQCKYADNYKAKNKRADEDQVDAGPNGQPLQRLKPGQNIAPEGSKGNKATHTVISALVASCILLALL